VRTGRPRKSVNEDVIADKYSSGSPSDFIAKEFGISVSTVLGILRKRGIPIRKRGSKTKFLFLKKDIDIIKKKYASGDSCAKIAIEFGVDHYNIEKLLKDEGVRLRGMTAYSNLNESFFENIDSEEKAYWLGFLAADGNIYKPENIASYQISIELSEIDLGHLKKFKEAISSTAKFYYRKDRKTWSIIFKSKKMWMDLGSHGIVQTKSKVLGKPIGVSKDLMRHFWRGYIEEQTNAKDKHHRAKAK